MTHRDLLYLITINEEGSFSSAARKLHVSQSALSQKVRALEKEYGFLFFIRRGIRLEPTRSLTALIAEGKPLLQHWQQFEADLREYAHGKKAELTVGMPSSFCNNLLPFIYPNFARTDPDVYLRIIRDHAYTLEKMVEVDSLGLSIIYRSPENDAIEQTHLFHQEMLLAVPKSHPFSIAHPYRGLNSLETIDISELRNEPFSLTMNYRVKVPVEAIFASAGFSPRVFRYAEMETLLQCYVQSGQSLAILSEMAVRRIPEEKTISYYRIGNTDIRLSVCAAHRRGRRLSPTEQRFLQAVSNYPCFEKQQE